MFERWEVKNLLIDICKENPNKMNPKNSSGTCLYTSDANPNDHCLVGQVLTDLGLGPPGPNYTSTANFLFREEKRYYGLFSEEAITLLDTAQCIADRDLPWGQVIKDLENS